MSPAETAQYGLGSSAITAIQNVLKKHPKVIKAILYGSRAKGNYRPASDIDLSLQGEQLDYSELVKIDNELDDLLLPYTIDLSLYPSIENPDLIDHIEQVGQVLYLKE
jgi:predicted nucleotidyltransferase